MKKGLLVLLLGLWFIPNVNAQNQYENDLKEEYVLKLSFNLIDRFYENGNMTMFIATWLNVNTAGEFEQVFPNFTESNNARIREKIFNGMIKTFGRDENLLYGNLLGVTYDRETALYWTEYLLKDYSSVVHDRETSNNESLDGRDVIVEAQPYQEDYEIVASPEITNNIRYQEIWDIVGAEQNDKGTFEIIKYEDWSCAITLSIKNKIYKSFECNEESNAKLKDENGNVIEIKFAMPELVDLFIDILDTDIRFDYTKEW